MADYKQTAAYQEGWAVSNGEAGAYVESPFTPWSNDDMAWECAMDDARIANEPSLATKVKASGGQASLGF